MRTIRLAALALAMLSGASLAGEVPRPASEFDLGSYAGRVVYIDFWASWCGPCLESFPWMEEMQAKYADQGLSIVAINVDADADKAAEFLRDVGHSFSIVMDPHGEVAERYNLQGMPTSFLIGREGQRIASHTGFRQKDRAELEERIRRALAADGQGEKS